MGDIKSAYSILSENLKVWDHTKDLGVYGTAILEE
jgi:hypothetical protein